MAGPTIPQRSDRMPPAQRRPVPPARPRRRLTRRGALALLAAVALLAGGVLYVLYGSPWLRVRHVRVTGTRVLTPAAVRAAAGVPAGEALASVDPGAVAARLRATLPRIASVRVQRSWPDAIALEVTEREPKALLKKGGKFVEVDADGVRYATDPTAPRGVPLVELTGAARSGSSDAAYFSTAVLLHSAVQVAADLPESVHSQTKFIEVGSFDGITLELTRGRSVLWGSPQDGRRKAVALTALLTADAGAAHYDVSAPSAPASSGS
ncbi:FtsQ-type POTRA domain-containing protein [Streptomyces sp. SL13]|uniref:Cell division protein FtsQ n=1 Tax=Streptantibioticus silvisoli TaxID=2705255 RepID=A0AA90K922_9ACTN|nr:FtsQ-type POTRA domain-containing protein [Streptantibioticus silvisoli]MDI5963591.1 FtsQ-type POTRA domain-containing protein [Streptantibioticus silvisoli]MDI5970257.1 FtsQ-type POTRA domain-containing protein [Streptantibioticus silvisoli]